MHLTMGKHKIKIFHCKKWWKGLQTRNDKKNTEDTWPHRSLSNWDRIETLLLSTEWERFLKDNNILTIYFQCSFCGTTIWRPVHSLYVILLRSLLPNCSHVFVFVYNGIFISDIICIFKENIQCIFFRTKLMEHNNEYSNNGNEYFHRSVTSNLGNLLTWRQLNNCFAHSQFKSTQ